VQVGVPADGGDDDGLLALGEAPDVLDQHAPVGEGRSYIALRNHVARGALRLEVALEHRIGGARIDVVGSDQEETAVTERAQEVDRRHRLLVRGRARIEDVW
jgi:hypothetical protein